MDTDDTGLLPDFCDVRVIFMLILLVEALAIVLAVAPSVSNFWDQLAFISMLMQWVGLLNAAILCAARQRLNVLSTRNTILVAFCLMMLISFSFSVFVLYLKSWMGLDDNTSPLSEHFLLRIMVMSAAIYAVVLRYFYVQQQWKLHLLAHSAAKIQALRARIRPHFLFNSMNTIASLVSFLPEKAEQAIEDLSDLFRASLREQNMNTLADEIKLTRSYVNIEALRLGDRLNVNWDIDENLNHLEIPALCLQPLVENAIYHGIEPLPAGGEISVKTRQDGKQLILEVINPVTRDNPTNSKGNHMAQENIKQRLQLVYGNKGSFEIIEAGATYCTTLRIPLEKQ